MGYETVEHTADVGFRAWGSGLEELFAEAARATVAIMGRPAGPVARSERVSLDAPDLGALLVDWLSELLFLFEARSVVPDRFDITVSRRGEDWRLEGTVEGPDAGAFEQDGPQVKAITFHGLEVRLGEGRAEARVYVDV